MTVDEARATAAVALADRLNEVCNENCADEMMAMSALCHAIAKRIAQLTRDDTAALRAVELIAGLLGEFTAIEVDR